MTKYQRQYIKFLEDFNEFKRESNDKAILTGEKYYLSVKLIDKEPVIYINSSHIDVNEFVVLGYFYNIRDCQEARRKYQSSILKFYKYSYIKSLGEEDD